jgi:hypothetical protein
MREGMRSLSRTFRGLSVLPKTQRNHALVLRARFTTLWRSEILINLKIDANPRTDAGVALVSTVQYIIYINDSEGIMLVSAHAYTAYAL